MADRRPAAWNQWAEVVGRDPRKTRFVGDMPHGWIASDFIRAALDLFAYERDTDNALVLAAGLTLLAAGVALGPLFFVVGGALLVAGLSSWITQLLPGQGHVFDLKIERRSSRLGDVVLVEQGPGG